MLTSSKGNYFILQKKETEASFFHHVKFVLFFGFIDEVILPNQQSL
jgi:hypothetical protein